MTDPSIAERREFFDRLYVAAAGGRGEPVPWDRGGAPHQLLADWAADRSLRGAGQRAGCFTTRQRRAVAGGAELFIDGLAAFGLLFRIDAVPDRLRGLRVSGGAKYGHSGKTDHERHNNQTDFHLASLA